MTRRGRALFPLLTLILLLPAFSHAMCWGLGGYRGSGSYDFEARPFLFSTSTKLSGTASGGGAELIFDSTCAGDERFNFRLTLGAGQLNLEDDKAYDAGGLTVISTEILLGVKVYAGESFRLMLGPTVGYGMASGEGPYLGDGEARHFSIGVATGLNWHVGRRVTLGLTLGVRETDYSSAASSSMNFGPEIDGHSSMGYLALTLFFRPEEDQYVRLPPPPEPPVPTSADK